MTEQRQVRKSIVLAAGRGTRLGPLTADRPKPMIAVQGAPVLEHILLGLQAAGISEYLLVVGYRADAIRGYFGDGGAWGVRIEYVDQTIPDGTGAALAMGRDFAAGDPVLATYGDILTDPAHYRCLVADYRDSQASAVIGINLLPDPAAGAAVYRLGNRMMRVVEKPPPGTAAGLWNVAGISVYGSAVWPALAGLRPSPRGEYELTDAISTLIAGEAPVLACELRGFWSDVGTPAALAEAERLFGRRK